MAEPTGPTPEDPQPFPGPGPSPAGERPASEVPPPPERPTVIDAVIDLLETVRDWVRQELGDAVHDKLAIPMQRVGTAIGAMFAAGQLLVIGLIFIAVALFMWLGQAIGYPGAFFLVGLVYVIGSGVFLYVKSRSMVR